MILPGSGSVADQDFAKSVRDVRVIRAQTPPIRVLRLRKADRDGIDAIGRALGVPLPAEPNRATGDALRVLWLAPGEWMIAGHGVEADAVLAAADAAAAAHLADVTEGRMLYVVDGPRSRDLLAKGCTLDLHRRTFPPGRCAQSALAQVFVLIERRHDDARFHIYADASYARHLDLWFEDALIEFGYGD